MKWFGNDADGLSKQDIEKIVLCVGFLGTVATACTTYWTSNPHFIDPNFVGFTTFVGLLMVGRKISSYWKPDRYDAAVEVVEEDSTTIATSQSTQSINVQSLANTTTDSTKDPNNGSL